MANNEISPPNIVVTRQKFYNKPVFIFIFFLVFAVTLIIIFTLIIKLVWIKNTSPAQKIATQSAQLLPTINVFTGIITDFSNNTLTMNTLPVDPKLPNKDIKNFKKFVITNATIFNKAIPAPPDQNGPVLQKINLSDLHPGMQATVFTDIDINSKKQIKALTINALVNSIQSAASTSASPIK